jgi:hypothetical protein
MGTFIVFGESAPRETGGSSRLMAIAGGSNMFGLTVTQEPEEVAKALGAGGMCRFTRRVFGKDSTVFVNPAAVLYIEESEITTPDDE